MKKRGHFTLIELLVVVSIISILASMLLPALGRAKEASYRAVCASNLKQMHMAITPWAEDHNSWLPAAQSCPWGNRPNWVNTMYLYHFFQLVDDYGLSTKMFACPSNLPDGGPDNAVKYYWGNWDYDRARQEYEILDTTVATNIAVTGGDPQYPSFHWSQSAFTGGVDKFFAQTGNYTWMGGNRQYDTRKSPAGPDQPRNGYWVMKLDWPTKTGTAYDDNPPWMSDMTGYEAHTGKTPHNHGSTYEFATLTTLYADGSAFHKKPDPDYYVRMGGPSDFYR